MTSVFISYRHKMFGLRHTSCDNLLTLLLALDLSNYCPSVLDTVGWVIWPVKIVADMTYNVFGGTLNPTLYLPHFHTEQWEGNAD